MTEHLSREEIKRLENKQLKGKAYTRALLHLNSCAECRSQLIIPSEEEMMQAIFGDDEPPPDENSKQNQAKENRENRQVNWREKLRNLLKLDGGILSFSLEFA